LLSCALAAPQFAYSATTFTQPFGQPFSQPFGRHFGQPFVQPFLQPLVPLPLARVPYNGDVFSNHLEPQEPQGSASHLPPSPYHFLPATLPRAIYSEPAHVLSGYSYQTLDPAGAKSQVSFRLALALQHKPNPERWLVDHINRDEPSRICIDTDDQLR